MINAGTSWEGVVWKQPPESRAGLLGDLKKAFLSVNKSKMALAFIILFPFIAAIVVALAAPPASAGSCVVAAIKPTRPAAKGAAYCNNPGRHTHLLWVHLKKDTPGWPNKTAATGRKRSSAGYFTKTTAGWLGSG